MRRLFIVVLALVVVAGCHKRRHHNWVADDSGDSTPPTVSSTVPATASTEVPVNSSISATFSEDMADSTINGSSFTVTGPGGIPVAGTVSYDPATRVATFLPDAPLDHDVDYTARITTGAEDLEGNALDFDYVWVFRTAADDVRPTVTYTIPAAGDPDVAINRKIVAWFSESMAVASISETTFLLTGPGATPVSGTVSYDATNNAASFLPDVFLAADTLFTARITTGATDPAGNSMASDFVWTFSTLSTEDTTRPLVVATQPADGEIDVPVNTKVIALFDEPMDSSSLTTTTFTTFSLQLGPTPVPGTVVCPAPGTSATFIPASNLAIDTLYTATVTTGVMDLAGNTLLTDYVWSFTTGSTVLAGNAAPDLQSAGSFAVLAGSTISNTGGTIVTGDIGVSPGSAIDGFPPGIVIGTTYGVGPIMDQAKLDLTFAYLDAKGRTLDSISCPGNLGGLTLAPGLYTNSSSVILSGTGPLGILTLDAGGDSTAVWIFQMGSSLTTDPGTSVVLSGGALQENVFWQVSSSATIGTTCLFKGNILCQESITLNTGAELLGRALTQTAAVTLDFNVVTRP